MTRLVVSVSVCVGGHTFVWRLAPEDFVADEAAWGVLYQSVGRMSAMFDWDFEELERVLGKLYQAAILKR